MTRGGRADIVAAALNQSTIIWPHVQVIKLHTNMRVQRLLAMDGPDAQANAARMATFAEFLKGVGDGTEQVSPMQLAGHSCSR